MKRKWVGIPSTSSAQDGILEVLEVVKEKDGRKPQADMSTELPSSSNPVEGLKGICGLG